jgi:hypothetical protein
MFEREHLAQLKSRLLAEPRRFMQVLHGPRQVGKTTLALQLMAASPFPTHFAAADALPSGNATWIAQQWESARVRWQQSGAPEALLIFDEIQKIEAWSEQVKKEWDRDSRGGLPLKVLLLGSSRLLLQQGLSESLAGRYEASYIGHWSFSEMRDAFQFSPDDHVWFGGYPGAVPLIADEARWKQYIQDALIEASVSRDILMISRVNKPALLRRLFELGCLYSGQILSYTKIMGQLQDAGNTTTLAHYLHLLDTAGLLAGLEKYSPQPVRQRSSSPKFQVHNTALMSAQQPGLRAEAQARPAEWGRRVESAIGAHLLHYSLRGSYRLSYWRQGDEEVDFVLSRGEQLLAIEVKSGSSGHPAGMKAFQKAFPGVRALLVGQDGIPWQEFLALDPSQLL